MTTIKFQDLEITNIRKTESRTLNLSTNGLTVVTGPNGSGKSTIPDAIRLCFHDQTLRGESATDALSNFAETGSSKLRFDADGTSYEVTNRITRARSTFEIIENGYSLTSSKEDLPTNIRALKSKTAQKVFMKELCPPAMFFNYLFFSASKGSTNTAAPFFMDLPAPDRKRFLEKFLPNLTVICTAEVVAKEDLQRATLEVEACTTALERFDEDLLEKEKTLTESKTNLDEDLKKNDAQKVATLENIQKTKEWLKAAQNAQTDLKAAKLLAEKHRLAYEAASKARRDLDTALEKLDTELRDEFTKKLRASQKSVQDLTTQLSEAEKQYRVDSQKATSQLQAEIDLIHKHSEEQTRESTVNITAEQTKISSFETELEGLRVAILQTEASLKELDGSTDVNWKCPTCESVGVKPAVAKRQKTLIQLREEQLAKQEKLTKQRASRQRRFDSLRTGVQSFQKDAQTQLTQLKTKKAEILKQLEEVYVKNTASLREILEVQSKQLQALEKDEQQHVQQHRKRIQLLKDSKASAETEEKWMKEVEAQKTLIVRLEATYGPSAIQDAVAQQKVEEKRIEYYADTEKNLRKRFKDAEEQFVAFKKNQKKVLSDNKKRAIQQQLRLKLLVKAFSHNGLRSYYLDQILPTFNRLLQKHTAEIAPNFRLSIRRDKKNVTLDAVNLLTGTKLQSFSSGETSIVSLVVLLALSDVLSAFDHFSSNVIVFDEIFDSLDKANSMLVLEALQRLSQRKRVVLLTHNEMYKNSDYADQIIDTTPQT